MVENKLKLIWEFIGIDADMIAKHHFVHLNEYVEKENLKIFKIGNEKIDKNISNSFMIISEDLLYKIKKDLRPHKAFQITK